MVGEHIRALKEGRWNHAIDCGDETVIHLADDEAAPRARRSYRPEFVDRAEVVQLVTHRARTFAPEEIVARAYSRMADPALCAIFRDSQAFAEWCATGRMRAGPRSIAQREPGDGRPVKAARAKAKPKRTLRRVGARGAPAAPPTRKKPPRRKKPPTRKVPAGRRARVGTRRR